MFLLASLLASALVLFIVVKPYQTKKLVKSPGKGSPLPIPLVPGGLPLIGHFHHVLLWPETFFNSCYKSYGPVFRIKLGFWNMAIICDRTFVNYIWSQKHLSANEFFEKTQVQEGQAVDNDLFLHKVYNQINTVSPDPQTFVKYAEALMTKLEGIVGKWGVPLHHTFQQYAHEIISHILYGVDISRDPGIYPEFSNYNYYSGVSAISAFFLPMNVVNWLYEKQLHKPTPKLDAAIEAQLSKNRSNPKDFLSDLKSDNGADGQPLTVPQLSEAFLRLNDATVHNLPSSILNTLLQLYKHPKALEAARAEASKLLQDRDYEGIMTSPILTASFTEASRLWISFLGSTFRALPKDTTEMCGYSMDGVDLIGTGGHVISAGEGAKEIYENHDTYQPERWLTGKKLEPVGTFGGRRHQCPAKNQEIKMVNMTVAHFLTRFEIDLKNTVVTPGPFLFRTVKTMNVNTCLNRIPSKS